MNSLDVPSRVRINEVVLRDGLQNEAAFVPTDEKIRLADRLSLTGVAKIEVTSFVSPKAIPNLRDAAEVMAGIARHPGVSYCALVPNAKGAEGALAAKADEINLVMSIGERHNLANMRMTCAQSLAGFRTIMDLVAGSGVKVNGVIATAFACPFEGTQPLSRVMWAIESYLELGMDAITLCDTTGMAFPTQVRSYCGAVRQAFPQVPLTLHFHDTRGQGLANVMAALAAGVDSFEGSLGGIGGCPYAPGATGNVCTEDVVHLLEGCGIATGVDLDSLLSLSREMPKLLGHDMPGHVMHAGKSSDLHAFTPDASQKIPCL